MTAAIRHQSFIPFIGILLIVVLLLSGGCSSVRLAYGQLDWWMDRSLNKYLDLDNSQEALLSQRVYEFHRWHRQTQLPRYANYMEQVANEVDVWNSAPARMRLEEQQLRAFWQASAGRLTELQAEVWTLAGDILQSATTEQRRHLKTTLQQYVSDFRVLAAN